MIEFRLGKHMILGEQKQVVELWENGKLIGCMYARDSAFVIDSKYVVMTGKEANDRMRTWVAIMHE